MPPPPKNSRLQLLVEGSDDAHSVIHLMSRHGYDWDDVRIDRPYVRPLGNDHELLEAVPVAVKASQYERIGVVIDTDANLARRWEQIRTRVAGLAALPSQPDPDGTIVHGPRGSRVGVWLMPDNSSPGNLENFLMGLVPLDDPTWSYAGEVVVEAQSRGAGYKKKDRGKSTLHTWLAWQEEPGLPFGTALKAEFFLHDSEVARRFVHWFQRLFGKQNE